MVTSHPSPFGTGEHRASTVGEVGGAFPTGTWTQLTEPKVLCPNRYQYLHGNVGDIPGAGHSGSLSCLGTWPDNSSHQPGRGQELEPLTHRPELAGHGQPSSNHSGRKTEQSISAFSHEGHEGFPPPILLCWFPGWVTIQLLYSTCLWQPGCHYVLPCAQCSKEGQGGEKKKFPCRHGHGRNAGALAGCATGCMQCSWQCWAGRAVSASLGQR